MDYKKIGEFISAERKAKKLTQQKFANMLYVSEKTVSKWENGNGLPDTSLLLKICEILDVNLNELLSGERLTDESYIKKAEDNLLVMTEQQIAHNKKMIMYEWVIGLMSSISFFALVFTLSFVDLNIIAKITLFILALAILFSGVIFALKIETETGFYQCKNCKHKYIPKYKDVFFAMHIGSTRFLKCPNCKKRTWNKKVIK